MMRKISWLILTLITLLAVYFAYETDANYLEFIKASSKVQVVINEGELRLDKDEAEIIFSAEITNPSPAPMWVEAMNYHLSINGQYGGYDYMEEARAGEISIQPGKAREIPLQTKVRADYLKLLLQMSESGQALVSISGEARMGFEIGRSGIKVFYPFEGVIWKESE
jgi:LEA14-like dessication related protein